MAQKARNGLVLFCLLALGSALVGAQALKSVEKPPGDGSRHRRSLLAATQQISQCNWIAGEGCALHPAYASYALNKSSEDVVAQYVANALACSTAIDKGLCEASSFCYWDPTFSNGQQGCFLQDDALLSLQLRCVQQQYVPSLSKLQACMAARQSCQCTTSNSISESASCSQRQVALLTNFQGSSRDKVCSSLLGCWMSNLNSSSTDLTALVETQLLVVQPKLESLSSASSEATSTSSSGGRRLLQIPPSLSDPVLDDKSSTSGDITPESGSYGSGTGSSSSAAGTPGVGMNGVVTEDQTASSVTTNTPVENGNNVPAPSKTNGSANSNTSAGLQLESGAVGNDWVLEAGPVDPDKVFGSSGSSTTGSGSSSSPTSSSSDSSSVQMTGGNAPASFWQCAAAAAAKADTTRKWADVDYNSKQLTLAIWIKVIQPTALIDWGVQVLECFKTQVPKLSNLDVSTNSTKPNKESLEFAIVALIRAFSGQAEAFRAYLQAGATARPTASLAALSRLVQDTFPSQLATLTAKQQVSPAYRRDVMLQAASIITDAQWFAADVRSLASASSDSTAQQEAFEAYINYAGESVRRCLYWLFYLTFDGPPAHLPGAIPSSAASSAVMAAFEGLAAAALPSRAVAADAAAWQQLMVMTATAAGHAAAAAAPYGADFDAGLSLSNTVAGLAKAHVQDMWGTRLELARLGASATGRQLALYDPNEKSTRWEPLRRQQITMLAALQQRAALGVSADGGVANERLSSALRELVAASGAYLVTSDSAVAQQQKQQELSGALGLSSRLALLIRQCYGSPAGLPALSAAAKAGVPAASAEACQQLAAQTEQLAGVGQGGVVGATLTADINRQWRCNAVPAGSCSSKPGCTLSLAPVLVPAVAPAAADKLLLSCQASDTGLLLSSLDSSAKSALAAGSTCDQFLKLPACESIGNAATCSSQVTCRWETTSQRNILHTAESASKAAAAAGSRGACAMDWVSVLSSTGGGKAYSSLNSMVQLCSGIGDSAQCESQTMLVTLDAPAPANASMARIWVPALVVAAVAGVLLFGAAIWWRRRSAAARRAAEEARSAAGGGRNSRRDGKGGKGGKGAKGTKKKPKRAEPGEYKPDLMRDSFTDYMRAAPQQFSNGVAIAKAAIATGDLDTAVAVADVAGGRQLAAMQQQSGAAAAAAGAAAAAAAQGPTGRAPSGSDGSSSSWGLGVGPNSSVPRSQGSSDLIDLSHSDTSGHNGTHNSAAAAAMHDPLSSGGLSNEVGLPSQQQQQLSSGRVSPTGGPSRGGPSAVWGSAAAAAGMGPELVSPRSLGFNQPSPVAARPPLHGGLSVPMNLLDADASIALTSSINLVSSLPQHSSLPCGFVPPEQQQQYGGLQQQEAGHGISAAALGAARAEYGASNGLQRTSGNSLASTAYGNRSFTEAQMQGANSGSLLLPQQHSRAGPASDDGSSCCHDSVCTWGPGPGSVVSSVGGGSRAGGAAAPGLRSQHSQRGAGSTAAAGGMAGVSAGGLSAAPSVPLSRSSWSSAISTDLLMVTQNSSAILDP